MQTVLENSLIVLDTVPEAYARFDRQLRLTFVNQAAQALLGTTRADLLGKTLSDVHPVSFGTSLQESCHRAMAEHGTVRLEHYSEPWRRWYVITAIPESSGGIVVQFSDITDRKLMEDSLWKSKEKFRKVFRSSPVPMCLVDVDKNACFLEVNDAFERITG
jgi:PAS domain S-box-containing protein